MHDTIDTQQQLILQLCLRFFKRSPEFFADAGGSNLLALSDWLFTFCKKTQKQILIQIRRFFAYNF